MSFTPTETPEFGPRAPATPGARGTGYPGSLLGIVADLRQTLLDAEHLRQERAAYAKHGGPRPPADDSLDALLPALDRTLPVVFRVESKREIERAMRLADEFRLNLILSGAAEGWKIAPKLASRKLPVLVSLNFGDEPGAAPARTPGPGRRGGGRPSPGTPPMPADAEGGVANAAQEMSKPEAPEKDDTPKAVTDDMRVKWMERVNNAARLSSAGVPFAFVAGDLRAPTDFWKNLRRAIKEGLPKQEALAALTINPARILGLERQMGTIEPGKMASLVIMTGDFTEAASRVKYLFIDRSRFEPDAELAASGPPVLQPNASHDDDGEQEGPR